MFKESLSKHAAKIEEIVGNIDVINSKASYVLEMMMILFEVISNFSKKKEIIFKIVHCIRLLLIFFYRDYLYT